MKKGPSFFCSTIGRKQLVGVTGLALSLFVLSHMVGNCLIFVGPEAYNMYGHMMITNPLIYLAEAGLMAMFIAHMGLAVMLTLENKAANNVDYAVAAKSEKGTGIVQKTMIHQGMIIFAFVVWHLITFKFGEYYAYTSTETGEEIRDLYKLLIEVFHQPAYLLGYAFCLIILAMHLSHGVSSAIRTLGFNHPKYDVKIRAIGSMYAVLVLAGFLAQPIFIYFFN